MRGNKIYRKKQERTMRVRENEGDWVIVSKPQKWEREIKNKGQKQKAGRGKIKNFSISEHKTLSKNLKKYI